MPTNDPKTCGCPGAAEILADITAENLLQLGPGERLWKLYCFWATSQPAGLRHRIYTKRKADGRLALVTFAVHDAPASASNGHPKSVRSGIARVPDLSIDHLDRLIEAIHRQAAADAYEDLDLSAFDSLEAQLAWLTTNKGIF